MGPGNRHVASSVIPARTLPEQGLPRRTPLPYRDGGGVGESTFQPPVENRDSPALLDAHGPERAEVGGSLPDAILTPARGTVWTRRGRRSSRGSRLPSSRGRTRAFS